jgi:MPBQ/MSBQ methyltransferase
LPSADQHAQETRLLHQGGRAGHWGSLGLWPAVDYASACQALADRVALAAHLPPGARILSPGCGNGEELTHWHRRYGAVQVIGVDRAEAAAGMRPGPAAVRRIQGDAMSLTSLCGAGFDAVLCVDAAYHFSPRADWLQQVRSVLKPGGWVVFTDLTLQPTVLPLTGARWLLAPVAQGAGIDTADLMPASAGVDRLKALGFTNVRSEALDSEVLDGFAAFVREQTQRLGQEAQSPGWRRVAATARALPWARRLGLGYALFCARSPESSDR